MPSNPPSKCGAWGRNSQISSGLSLVRVNLKSLKHLSFGLLANLDVKNFPCFYEKCLGLPPQKKFLKKDTALKCISKAITRRMRSISISTACFLWLSPRYLYHLLYIYYIGIGAKGTNRNKWKKSKEMSVASPRSRIVRSIIVQN